MPKYLIERTVPGAGELSADELSAIASRSCDVLRDLGSEIQWLESYVTDDKIVCVYLASDPELIRRHGQQGEFPVDSISRVRSVIDPVTGEQTA